MQKQTFFGMLGVQAFQLYNNARNAQQGAKPPP